MSDSIGERLRVFRKYRNMTQADLAKPLGRSSASISDWEKGKARPSIEDIQKISELLECSASRLAFGNSEQPENRVEESLQGYGKTDVVRGVTPSSVILDPAWKDEKTQATPTTIHEVVAYLEPWLEACKSDPNVPPIMLHQLKKHLPHIDLEST